MAKGEILVFSDANSMYDSKALEYLLSNLYDSEVGVVCGELRYSRNERSDEGLYWKLERLLKQSESILGSCLGANGAIYAMRKELYRPLPAEACSDFIEPFAAYEKGYRVVYEPQAFCVEPVSDNAQEFRRKQRIVSNSLQSLYLIQSFLSPFKYGWYSISLWSHKVFRWYAFVFLILLFISNIFLATIPFFFFVLVLQVAFYVLAVLGIFFKQKIFSIPHYFTAVNVASFLAVVDLLLGRRVTSWEKVR